MTTFERELIEHCEALLAVLAEAGVPCTSLADAPQAPERWVALRPALQALRFSQRDQRWIEAEIREDPNTYQPVLLTAEPTGWQVLLVRLHPLTIFIQFGRHAACTAYARWHCHVTSALLRYGYYDPLTNHTPPVGQQLDALERREEGRDLMNTLIPGLGDVFSGHRPRTEEGRRLWWYQSIDPETGEPIMINDADIPEEDEDDDAF